MNARFVTYLEENYIKLKAFLMETRQLTPRTKIKYRIIKIFFYMCKIDNSDLSSRNKTF